MGLSSARNSGILTNSSLIRTGIKKLLQVVYKPILVWYLQKDRYYTVEDGRILVKKGVFHPAFFFSTRFLLCELKKEQLTGKTVLELGAGSGLLSFYAAKRGAQVTATDINPVAIEGLKINLKGFPAHIIHSDLFDAIPPQIADYILINPPYYPKNPANDVEKAWYCGEHFDYFEKLFQQLESYMQLNTQVWLSLSQDCDIMRIMEIAHRNDLRLTLKIRKRIWWEENFIYRIST
jgi:release factor glutamine methyltransferase